MYTTQRMIQRFDKCRKTWQKVFILPTILIDSKDNIFCKTFGESFVKKVSRVRTSYDEANLMQHPSPLPISLLFSFSLGARLCRPIAAAAATTTHEQHSTEKEEEEEDGLACLWEYMGRRRRRRRMPSWLAIHHTYTTPSFRNTPRRPWPTISRSGPEDNASEPSFNPSLTWP